MQMQVLSIGYRNRSISEFSIDEKNVVSWTEDKLQLWCYSGQRQTLNAIECSFGYKGIEVNIIRNYSQQ